MTLIMVPFFDIHYVNLINLIHCIIAINNKTKKGIYQINDKNFDFYLKSFYTTLK